MRVTFPWPDKALSANARHAHWSQRAKPAKAARETAYWLTRSAMASGGPFPGLAGNGEVMLHITFHPPTKRRYDLDGLLTRCKPLLDGFADAIEVNDYRFAMTIRRADPVAGGQVVIEIAP